MLCFICEMFLTFNLRLGTLTDTFIDINTVWIVWNIFFDFSYSQLNNCRNKLNLVQKFTAAPTKKI